MENEDDFVTDTKLVALEYENETLRQSIQQMLIIVQGLKSTIFP